MLGKLIKHEYKQTGKTMLPMLGAVLVLAGLTKISMFIGDMTTARFQSESMQYGVFSFITDLLSAITIFAFIAAMAAIVILSVTRFYKNMLGDEGYLMFTLPVSAQQHIFAKLLVAFSWTLAGIVVCAGAVWLFVGDSFPQSNDSIFTLIGQAAQEYGSGIYLMPVMLMLALFMGIFVTYLQFYTAISIGGQWQQTRLVASVVSYVGINVILQTLSAVGFWIFGMIAFSNQNNVTAVINTFALDPVLMFNTVFGCISLVLAALCVIYFFITRWLLSKKLNLA